MSWDTKTPTLQLSPTFHKHLLPFKPKGTKCWRLKRKATPKPKINLDKANLVLEIYEEPKKKKKLTKEDATKILERQRKLGAERQKRYREKKKKEIEEAMGFLQFVMANNEEKITKSAIVTICDLKE